MARFQARITAVLLLLTGGYVATYWWPAITGHRPTGHGLPAIDRWSATSTTWLQDHTSTVAAAALALIVLTAAAATTARLRRRSRTKAPVTTTAATTAKSDRHAAPARDDHAAAPHT
jgi:ABC-type phosphate transport system permease subunit